MSGDDTLDTFGKWAERESPSYAAVVHLDLILNRDRVGTVQGVEFDFRHHDLPGPETWHSPEGRYPFGITFPWDRGDGGEPADCYVTGYGEDEPVVHVYSGDKVSIGQVRRFSRGGYRPPYVDDHDAHALWAYLTVRRSDGTMVSSDEPIQFNARDAMGPHSPHIDIADDGYADFVGDFRVTFDKVRRRIERLYQAAPNRAGEWLKLAAEALGEAETEAEYIKGKFPSKEDSTCDLSDLLDLTAAAAYALAKAEAAPVIRKSFNRTRPATLARRTRTNPVREAAKADILANPKTTQTACARRVALKLERDQRSMEKLITPMFEWVTLPGGAKEKRPRHIYTNPRQIDGWPGLPSV